MNGIILQMCPGVRMGVGGAVHGKRRNRVLGKMRTLEMFYGRDNFFVSFA